MGGGQQTVRQTARRTFRAKLMFEGEQLDTQISIKMIDKLLIQQEEAGALTSKC